MTRTFMQLLADPQRQHLPLDAPLTMVPDSRDAVTYQRVVDQFDVEHSPRYAPKRDATYCNIFATDVAKACGVNLPHVVEGRELTVNDTDSWLRCQEDWDTVREPVALTLARVGIPVFAITTSRPDGHGHIGVLLPDGLIACAGRRCRARATVGTAFAGQVPTYWVNR